VVLIQESPWTSPLGRINHWCWKARQTIELNTGAEEENKTQQTVFSEFNATATHRTQGLKLLLCLCPIAPALATTDRGTGHFRTYTGILVSRLGCHARGGDMWHLRRITITPANLGCHTSTPAAAQARHNYYSKRSNIDMTLSRMHARTASRRRRARKTR